jgi:hypothetical protein
MYDSPSAAEMLPHERHFVDRDVIFDQFRSFFCDSDAFRTHVSFATWKSLGAEKYDRTIYVPGTLYADYPYALNDAKKLAAFVTHRSRVLATQAAVLFHMHYAE